jgi:hypothetical protein
MKLIGKIKSPEEKIKKIEENPRIKRIVDRRYERMDRKYEKASGDEDRIKKLDKKYGYDYESAKKAGLAADETGHWPSIGEGGLVLKGKKHPSMILTKKVEKVLGNKIVNRNGRQFSEPKK